MSLRSCVALGILGLLPLLATAADKDVNEKIKEVAGAAEFLRSVPKHFATLKAMDRSERRVTLLFEGETEARSWPLATDAELKIAGWWGRLEQFQIGDRVWVWMQVDRVKQPVAISMMADELSEQDIHGANLAIAGIEGDTVTIRSGKDKTRTLKLQRTDAFRGKEKAAPKDLKATDEKVYLQTSGDRVRLLLDAAAMALRRDSQQEFLRKRWAEEGLPGTVTFLHQFGGEMDFMLDHEAMRWGRSLTVGDKVSLHGSPPIPAVVKDVRPWRERTQLRLVVNSFDQADLKIGQRVLLRMPAPKAELDKDPLPPDLDRPRSKAERIEWFLASIYCTCAVKGDNCTGHFYTLASCNVNGCGMPNAMRKRIGALIDKEKTDRQIFEELQKEQGPNLLRQHLLP